MQRIAHLLANTAKYEDTSRGVAVTDKTIEALKNKKIPIFMLSNQLPMLQLGRELPEVAGQNASYCDPKGVITTSVWSVKRRLSPSAIPMTC